MSVRLLAPVAVVGLLATACGDDPDASGPPVLRVNQAGAGGLASPTAGEAADMSMSSSKMMPYYQMHFTAAVDLPALDSDAPAYEVTSVGIEGELAALKQAFGLADEFAPIEPEMGGGWMSGPNDGTAPSMSVYTWAGMSNWNYSPAWADSIAGSVSCETVGVPAVGVDDTTPAVDPAVTPVPEPLCAVPEPPANVPTADEAEARFTDIMDRIGVNLDDLVIESWADEWSANVTGYLKVDGVRSPISYSVGFGGEGEIQWAGGFIGNVVRIADYPRIGTTAALERLNESMGYGGWSRATDDVVVAPAVEPIPMDIAPSGVADAVTVPVDSSPAVTEPELPEPVIEEVSVVGVEEELQMLYGDDVTYLVPGYAFIGEEVDGYTPRWTAVAIPDEYIEQAVPVVDTVVDVPETGVAVDGSSPAGGSDAGSVGGSSDDPVIDVEELLVGATEAEAEKTANQNGLDVRVVERDGEQYAVTMDYRTDRVNLRIADGKVTAAYIG